MVSIFPVFPCHETPFSDQNTCIYRELSRDIDSHVIFSNVNVMPLYGSSTLSLSRDRKHSEALDHISEYLAFSPSLN